MTLNIERLSKKLAFDLSSFSNMGECQDYVEISQVSQPRMSCGGWALLKNTRHNGMKKEHMARFVNLGTSFVRPIKAVG